MSGAPRDTRLDLWRGLCLIDVVLVHLAFNGLGFPAPLDDAIRYYTRFAAGGFVLLAGLTVAVVFGPAVERGGTARAGAYERLRRRAAVLLLVDVFASAALRLLDTVRVYPADPDTPLTEALWAIVFLQRPGITGGIFLLYAILLAATPVLFALRRRAGGWGVALMSTAAYGGAVVADGALHWPPYEFPVLYWQPLFVAGFLSLPLYTWMLRGSSRRRWAWAVASSACFAALFLVQFSDVLGISAVARAFPLDFRKTPLQPGALLAYLAAVQLVLAWTTVAWGWIERGRAAEGVCLLGRHSLLVYTAHVFTEIPVMEYVWAAWPPAVLRVILSVADLAALGMLAGLAEGAWRVPVRSVFAHPARWATAGGSLLGAALLFFTIMPSRDHLHDDILELEATVLPIEAGGGVIEPAILECEGEDCSSPDVPEETPYLGTADEDTLLQEPI